MVERPYLAVLIVHRVLPNCTPLSNDLLLYVFYNSLLVLKNLLRLIPKTKSWCHNFN